MSSTALSDNEDEDGRDPSPQEAAALEWVVRSDRGLSSNDKREFESCLDADPEHPRLFEEFQGTWLGLATACGASIHPLRDACRSARRRGWVAVGMAAACLIVGYAVAWRPHSYQNAQETRIGEIRVFRLPD